MSASLSPAELIRYSRQVLLPEIGLEGQRRLQAARVLVVGAGGLGSPAALYLAAAGVGTLGIADFDTVARHNLHRQLLHRDATVDQPKVASAAAELRAINPHIRIATHPEGVRADQAVALFAQYDVVVDGTDNFGTRYLNNDAAVLARVPLVHGSIFRFEGQVTVFAPHLGGPCYRCLFPEPPTDGAVPNCAEAGVLGGLCGVIGSLMALEALKLAAGFGEPLIGRLLTYDALQTRFATLALPRDPACPACGANTSLRAPLDPTNYGVVCATPTAASVSHAAGAPPSQSMSSDHVPLEISVEETRDRIAAGTGSPLLIDVREPHEVEICRIEGALHIPMRRIPEQLAELPTDRHLLIYCHHGGRSLRVTEYLRSRGLTHATNVGGGIDAWAERIEPGMARY